MFDSHFNFSIRSGILDSRRMLDMGMKIGLGTGDLYIDSALETNG